MTDNVIELSAARVCARLAAIAQQPAAMSKGVVTRDEAAVLRDIIAELQDARTRDAERLATLETVNRRLRGDMANMVARLSECTCANTHPVIDLVKHDELPSRANPFAAAVAVRIVSEKREVL